MWSKDGKNIIFANNRNGNSDVYLMPAIGGKAKRLTYHSSHDVPQDLSKNNKKVLFTSVRQDSAALSLEALTYNN